MFNHFRFPKYWRSSAIWSAIRTDDRLLLMIIGIIVGTCSGMAAIVLNKSLIALLEWLGSYRHLWWAFVIPAAGAALSSLFLEKIMKESAGHGVPEVIYSVSRYGGLLRLRSSFSRLISSCLTIGSGGSAGPEAPVVMSGAAIGSNIAKLFSLNDRQRIAIVGCGAAGAISSIFNAPIAGIVFSVEVVLGEWTAINIIPIAFASVAGAEISRLLQGNQIAFDHRLFHIEPGDILASIGLALFCAIISITLTRTVELAKAISPKIPAPIWVRAAIGGCAVGMLGIFLPMVLGEGYSPIRNMIEGVFSPGLGFVTLLLIAKIIATSLTLGMGGSGGIFAPSLVIGSLSGLAYHRFISLLWPSVSWVNEGCFALLGMAGLLSGILQAPLTGIFLIIEITGGYDVILPLIAVSALSTTLCHYMEPASFYLKELVKKGHLLRPGTDARVLTDLRVYELLEKDCIPVHQNMLLRDFINIIKQSHRNYYPVNDELTGGFIGMIHLDDIRPFLFNTGMYDAVILEQIMDTQVEIIHPDDDLTDILHKMDSLHLFSMPVVSNKKFIGMISKATLLDQYRKELMVQTSICQ